MLQAIDHVHVHVSDRAAAVAWYRRALDLEPDAVYAAWAHEGGPLTLVDASRAVHLALFEKAPAPNHATIALRVDAVGLLSLRDRLAALTGERPALVDHGLSWSIYFSDPDGNPYELTTYDVAGLRALQGDG